MDFPTYEHPPSYLPLIDDAVSRLVAAANRRREEVLGIPLPDGWCWEESNVRDQERDGSFTIYRIETEWHAVRIDEPGEPGATRYLSPPTEPTCHHGLPTYMRCAGCAAEQIEHPSPVADQPDGTNRLP